MLTRLTRLAVAGLILTVAHGAQPAAACSSFMLKSAKGPIMAKNFDWDIADGMLLVNPRGLAKTAMIGEIGRPARWTSRYGSVSFNQFGREFPMGGMNEVGLAMEVLWLDATEYPQPGDRATIGPLQWVQYCLDSFRSVEDVVASASELTVAGAGSLHFLACDATTNCAVIEFLGGEAFTRSGKTLPLPALTNDPYNASLTYLNRTLGYGGEPITPEGPGSLARFARTANGLHAARARAGDDPVRDAFAILADVAQPESTQWSIVYQLAGNRVTFKTSTNPEVRVVELSGLDLDCTAEPMGLDLGAKLSGDVTTSLAPTTPEANLELVKAGFSATKIQAPSDEAVAAMAAYPDLLLCTFAADAK